MTNENPLTIEVHGPQESQSIVVPDRWCIHDLEPIRALMLAAGYESCTPITAGSVLAFRPSDMESSHVGRT